jgi:WhiB family redox-sensing transcriptional regulator
MSWQHKAACLDVPVDVFFPQPGPDFKAQLTAARNYCLTCPVKLDCLRFAMNHEAEHGERSLPGVWGGTTERERWKLRRTPAII